MRRHEKPPACLSAAVRLPQVSYLAAARRARSTRGRWTTLQPERAAPSGRCRLNKFCARQVPFSSARPITTTQRVVLPLPRRLSLIADSATSNRRRRLSSSSAGGGGGARARSSSRQKALALDGSFHRAALGRFLPVARRRRAFNWDLVECAGRAESIARLLVARGCC